MAKDDSEKVEAIASLIRSHRGKAHIIDSGEIARTVGIREGDTRRRTRHLIKEVMKKHGIPIGGLKDGYFVVETPEELAECLYDLNVRIDGTEERIHLLKETFYKVHGEPESTESDED